MSQPFMLLSIAVVLAIAVLALALLVSRGRPGLVRRVEALFRRPRKPAKGPRAGHYYKAYWS